MTLIVETGAALADAESYASVADALTYHAARGNATWATITESQQEQALRRATDYMAGYRGRWAGCRVSSTQALDWPRYDVPMRDAGGAYYPSDAVPATVRNACAELALRAAAGDLSPDLKPPKLRTKVGPIETEYAEGARQTTRFYGVELMLAPFMAGSANSVPVSRA